MLQEGPLPGIPSTLLLLIDTKALQGIQQRAQQGQHGLALATHLVFHLRKTIHEKGGSRHPNTPQLRATCEQIVGAVVVSETILHHNIKFQSQAAAHHSSKQH